MRLWNAQGMRVSMRGACIKTVFAILCAASAGGALRAQTAPADAAAPPLFPAGALEPGNLAKSRPKPPFDLTGTWFVDLSAGFSSFMFGPPYPTFKPKAQAYFEAGRKAFAQNRTFHDDIGKCFPAGMPMIMTRVWPIAMVQLPTVIYMVSGFENALRLIYLDGRAHTDPDIVVRSFNGDSVGHWEGDTLVVDTTSLVSERHWIDMGIPVSNDFHIIEHIRLLEGGAVLEIRYTLLDPQNWQGEWQSTKHWKRVVNTDITEVECLPNLNEHLRSIAAEDAAH
jgi:hypothetical protein